MLKVGPEREQKISMTGSKSHSQGTAKKLGLVVQKNGISSNESLSWEIKTIKYSGVLTSIPNILSK